MITGPQCTKTLAQRESTGGRWGGKVAHVCMPECKYQRKAHVLALGNLGERSMECLTVVASVLPYELGSYSLFRFFLNDDVPDGVKGYSVCGHMVPVDIVARVVWTQSIFY